jgi:hypothetical protein
MFTSTCHCNPFVILVLSFLRRPRAPSFAARIVLLRIPTQVRRKFDAWFEIDLKLIADRLEIVSLIFFVPHAMGLLAVVFLAMWARVLLWLIVLGLLFLLFLARRGLLGFLVLAFARLALLLSASCRALTPSAPASSVKIVWSDVASCT